MAEVWESATLAEVNAALRRMRSSRLLVRPHFPHEVASSGYHGDWPLIGWAMLARIGGTADSLIALIPPRRATDAGVLLRTMFEATVTFAWIGIAPAEHAEQWLRSDLAERIKVDNDFRRFGRGCSAANARGCALGRASAGS